MTSAISAAASGNARAPSSLTALAALLCVGGCGRIAFEPSAPVDARPCGGSAHSVIDNFDDNTRDSALWGNAFEDAVSRHAEAEGRLVITIGANAAFDWAGYTTTTTFELADDRVFVEVDQISAPDANTVLLLATDLNESNGPSIESEKGSLVFRLRIANVIHDRGSVSYDPVAHRWWQIRERDGITYWELSRDGATWTVGHQEPTNVPTASFITLAAGSEVAVAAPGTAIFDNLNGGGPPPACP